MRTVRHCLGQEASQLPLASARAVPTTVVPSNTRDGGVVSAVPCTTSVVAPVMPSPIVPVSGKIFVMVGALWRGEIDGRDERARRRTEISGHIGINGSVRVRAFGKRLAGGSNAPEPARVRIARPDGGGALEQATLLFASAVAGQGEGRCRRDRVALEAVSGASAEIVGAAGGVWSTTMVAVPVLVLNTASVATIEML